MADMRVGNTIKGEGRSGSEGYNPRIFGISACKEWGCSTTL
ncbi:hypothetical protein LINGRAPRIM_LOCUS2160 [Linum grandiflorum]